MTESTPPSSKLRLLVARTDGWLPVINDMKYNDNLSEELPVINDTSAKMTSVAYDLCGC